jgi:hypothetical protein
MSAQEQMSGSPSMWKRLRELEVELVQVKRDHMADVRALNKCLQQNKTIMKLTNDRNALVQALQRIIDCKSVAVARMIATDALVDAGEMK